MGAISCFIPEVPVANLPENEREAAKKMYAMVDSTAAKEIQKIVETEFDAMSKMMSKEVTAYAKEEFRNSWLLANYTHIIARVMNTRSKTSNARGDWSFDPEVAIDTLPGECHDDGKTIN